MIADNMCDWITSLSFYKDGSPQLLYLWPSGETLTALQLSDNTSQSGSGTLSSSISTTVTLSVGNQIIVGDRITNVTGESTQTVTGINSDSTSLTIYPGFSTSHSGFTGWDYNGYFTAVR